MMTACVHLIDMGTIMCTGGSNKDTALEKGSLLFDNYLLKRGYAKGSFSATPPKIFSVSAQSYTANLPRA